MAWLLLKLFDCEGVWLVRSAEFLLNAVDVLTKSFLRMTLILSERGFLCFGAGESSYAFSYSLSSRSCFLALRFRGCAVSLLS